MEGEQESRTHGGGQPSAYPFERQPVSPYAQLSTEYRVVSTERDAQELSRVVLDPHRERPVVVVTTAKDGPRFKPEEVARRLGPEVDVYLLSNTAVAFDFEREMPEDGAVYGGAARSYPPGTAWTKNPRRSVLRTAYTEAEARDVLELIADDVDAMVPLAFQQPQRPAPAAEPVQPAGEPVRGRVSAVPDPSTALVTLDDGAVGRVELPVCPPCFDPASLLPLGCEVSGHLVDGLLELDGRHTPADAADYAVEGSLQLALVASEKSVMLFPGLEVKHKAGTAPGSVVAVLVELAGRADGKAWRLSTVPDPDLEEVDPALPFLEGGGPWISWPHPPEDPGQQPGSVTAAAPEPERVAADAPAPAERPAVRVLGAFDAFRAMVEDLIADNDELRSDNAHLSDTVETLSEELDALGQKTATGPIPTVSPQAQEIAKLNARIAGMQRDKLGIVNDLTRALRDADQLATENAELARTNERLRGDVRTERERANHARQAAQRAAGETSGEPPADSLFADPADQFRHEVYLEWARRIPAASKAELPLAEYELAPGFLPSVDALHGIERSKIVAVAVEVLTGLADRQPGREMHRLRGGAAGCGHIDDPELGTAWRVSLQAKTASARRMHFWRGADGKVVFASVGVHDEMGI